MAGLESDKNDNNLTKNSTNNLFKIFDNVWNCQIQKLPL